MTKIRLSSLTTFRLFIARLPDGTCDASQVISHECYVQWLDKEGKEASDSELRKFQRTLSNHLAGVDGRLPFDEDEEEALLKVVRQKKRWPCCPDHLRVGSTGFRSMGYHEKQAKLRPQADLDGIMQSVANAQDRVAVRKLAEDITLLASSPEEFDLAAWRSILGLLRFLMFAKTPVCALDPGTLPNNYHKDLCDEHASRAPGTCVLVGDLTASDPTKTWIAQNRECFDCLGDIDDESMERPPIHFHDLLQFSAAICAALYQIGFAFAVHKIRFAGQRGEFKAHNAQISIDPGSFALIIAMHHP